MVAKPLNPAELKLDLLCSGLRVGEESHATEGARPLASSRAGLGSGLELVIPGHRRDVWVNAPVVEKFVQRTPYRLQCGGTSHFIVDGRTGFSYPVRLAPRPSWYDQSTSSGLSMFRVAVLHGTCLFINVGERCRFWGADEAMACRFCSTGLDPGWDDGTKIGVEDVVQTALRARSESNVTFVMLHAGYQGPGALEQAFSFVKALKERVGVLVGLQFVPEEDLALYDRVIALGVDHLSFSFEFYNPDYFRRYLPGKDSMVGRRQFFRALEHCARRLPKGRVSAEMIAGIEPLRDTLSAVDYIGCIGAYPLVCVFRPLLGTELENHPPPRLEDMVRVFRRVYETCRVHSLPIGVAPNVNWSLSMQPEDTFYLAGDGAGDRMYRRWVWTLRLLMRPYFYRQFRPHK